MRSDFIKLLLLLCTMTYCTTICKADGIPVYTYPGDDNTGQPHRAPVNEDVYAVFDRIDCTLSLIVSPEVEISDVEIYKDGSLIITDNIPTLLYILSSYGSGAYTIELNAVGGTTYTGYFSY